MENESILPLVFVTASEVLLIIGRGFVKNDTYPRRRYLGCVPGGSESRVERGATSQVIVLASDVDAAAMVGKLKWEKNCNS